MILVPYNLQLARTVILTSLEGTDDKPVDDKPVDDKNKVFTQAEVNNILKKEKEKTSSKITELKSLNDKLRNSSNLTTQEKETLEARVEEIEQESLSKEQISKREAIKAKSEYDEALGVAKGETSTWKNLFTQSTISRVITDAAVAEKAFQPSQIVALLGDKAKLVEAEGVFEVRITQKGVDEKGKPIDLILGPTEAIKLMKEDKAQFGNLFTDNLTPGVGKTSGGGSLPKGMPNLRNPAEYAEWRKTHTVDDLVPE